MRSSLEKVELRHLAEANVFIYYPRHLIFKKYRRINGQLMLNALTFSYRGEGEAFLLINADLLHRNYAVREAKRYERDRD